jgi:hypothetical protein
MRLATRVAAVAAPLLLTLGLAACTPPPARPPVFSWPTGFTATYAGPDDNGNVSDGQTNGDFTLTAVADPDNPCTGQSSCGYVWTSATGHWDVQTGGCGEHEIVTTTAQPGPIGGGGLLETTAAPGYDGEVSFSVQGSEIVPGICAPFVPIIVVDMSARQPWTPGSSQTVWQSTGGGTFVVHWTY